MGDGGIEYVKLLDGYIISITNGYIITVTNRLSQIKSYLGIKIKNHLLLVTLLLVHSRT
jgi:hypothetical protein